MTAVLPEKGKNTGYIRYKLKRLNPICWFSLLGWVSTLKSFFKLLLEAEVICSNIFKKPEDWKQNDLFTQQSAINIYTQAEWTADYFWPFLLPAPILL